MSASLWQKEGKLPQFPSLRGDHKTEVLVVGGGMAGLLTAYLLHQRGVPCILVEKDRIACGTTANTTAKITFQHGFIYDRLLRQCGFYTAQGYLDANRAAFARLTALCRRFPCDFETRDNYVYTRANRAAAEAEMAALRKLGFSSVFREKLPLPFRTKGAVCFPHQAQMHPLKLLAALCRDLPIYENTPVREIRGRRAFTEGGRITASHILVTTHFPIINLLGGYFLKLYQHRSYVLALRGAKEIDGMYVDEADTGLSFRSYRDLLLFGGAAHRTGVGGCGFGELRRLASLYYPHAEECAAFATQDCMSLDGMPYIGQYASTTPQIYTACGFNKWGMTGSMLAAMLLTDAVTGKKNEYAEIFSPARHMPKGPLLKNGAEAVKNLLSPGKRCTHMGCALHWNKEEHSWDCACHGSRFSRSGQVLDTPANRPLR